MPHPLPHIKKLHFIKKLCKPSSSNANIFNPHHNSPLKGKENYDCFAFLICTNQ